MEWGLRGRTILVDASKTKMRPTIVIHKARIPVTELAVLSLTVNFS